MNYEREQKYCVVATVDGVRKAITGPMTKNLAIIHFTSFRY